MELLLRPFRHYFDCRGRSGRAELWLFVCLSLILLVLARPVDQALGVPPRIDAQGRALPGAGPALAGVMLLLFVPGVAVTIRRLHDTGRRGWWMLLPIAPPFIVLPLMEFVEWLGFIIIGVASGAGLLVLLILLCLPGTSRANRFGPPA
jgi:uncharacterized membrane protein YhaH (DUF805 family)